MGRESEYLVSEQYRQNLITRTGEHYTHKQAYFEQIKHQKGHKSEKRHNRKDRRGMRTFDEGITIFEEE